MRAIPSTRACIRAIGMRGTAISRPCRASRARRWCVTSARTRATVVVTCALAVVTATKARGTTTRAGRSRLENHHRSTYGARGGRTRGVGTTTVDAMDASSYPSPIVVEPRDGSVATSACIMLHGLGDTGRGWAGAATQIATPRHEKVRWIFPTAKTVPVTLNGGMRMTAWFDLNALDESSIVDDRGMIEESARYVDALVREQMEKGIPSEKIIVAGFSQGGAIALTASLRSEVKLGGCMALSTYLPLRGDYPEKFGPHARGLKILQGHGTHDMVLQYTYGQKSYELLKEKGMDVEFKTYAGMAHSACAEEFDDIADFLASTLAA
jgi:predicted esterase